MIKKLLFLPFLVIYVTLLGQINIGYESNSQWYIDDNKIKLSEKEAEKRIRNNVYLKASYILDKWDFGIQLESYEPKASLNYSPEFDGTNIGIVYTNYKNDKIGLDASVGHIYEQFGNGLVLRFYEDRQLGINNALLGIKIGYSPINSINTKFIAGKQRIGMGFDLSDGTIFGGDVEINLIENTSPADLNVRIGVSYVGRYEDLGASYDTLNIDNLTNLYGGRIELSKGNFFTSAEYIYKSKDVYFESFSGNSNIFNDSRNSGSALQLDFGYTEKGFGTMLNLRRLENFNFYSERFLSGNAFNMGVVNYIPSLVKQYDFSLQNIYVYQSQPNLSFIPLEKSGEIGGQLDIFYNIKKGTKWGGKYGMKLNLHGAYFSGLKADYQVADRSYNTKFLRFGQKLYRDFGLEIKKKWSKNWLSVFHYLNQYYNRKFIEEKAGEVNTHIAVAEATYKFNRNKSLKFDVQHLWADADKKDWVGGGIEFSYNSNLSFYLTDIYNYGNDLEEEKIHYYNVGGSYSKGTTRIALNYGRQRGGLLCVGGICRIVSEAAGLTLSVSTSF